MLCFSGSEKVFVKVTFSVLASPWLWVFICCKTSQKFFFEKKIYIYICVFYKIYVICRKKIFLYETKILCRKKAITDKNFFSEKKFIFYTENICVANKKIYLIILQKNFFDHKKYICENFLANSIIWSFKFLKHPIVGIS